MLTHLENGWQVDQALQHEQDKLVLIRFGRDHDTECMLMDEMLASIAPRIQSWCEVYVVDKEKVPDFNKMYELYDKCTIMIFWRNRHMLIDLGTGNNNKINWVLGDKQELLDILEVVYKGARKGKGLVVSPRDYSTHYRY